MTKTTTGPGSAPSSLEEMGRTIGKEVGEIVSYLNNDVVPKAREHSSQGLRVAAEKLLKLAEYMDQHKPPAA
ncbi:MAG: hypothetical protein ACRD2R_00070 [Terriglobales bacterium]